MSRFTAIDLSGLAPPDILETLDFEAIVTAMRNDLVQRFPAIADVIDLESEPARKLIEAFAYRESSGQSGPPRSIPAKRRRRG
jgi:phage-related baseplate assembly protein